jgi:Putative beta-barrel porin-2, OmpL-like. bbp2
MGALESIGVGKPLESWGININGYVEMGYLYDFTTPRDVTPAKTAPGDAIFFAGPYKNSFILDQADLSIARVIDATKGKFDVGFQVEGLYGRDAAFIHSNGIFDNTTKHGTGGFSQPDLEQAFVTVAIPVGNGLQLKAGKFATLMGEETINPTTNAFYSHTYSFSYGIPLTQTGVLATYYFNSQLNATAGFTRGWNESTSDNNGAIDFLGQVDYTGDKWSLIGNLSVGPEGVVGTLPYGPKDNSDYWAVPEIIASYKMSDQLTLSADMVYGLASSMSQWYGGALYAGYTFSTQITLNGRVEYYHDGHGATTAVGGVTGGRDVNYWAATVGTHITPFPNDNLLKNISIRPELRYDIADHGVFEGTKFNELTASIDALLTF